MAFASRRCVYDPHCAGLTGSDKSSEITMQSIGECIKYRGPIICGTLMVIISLYVGVLLFMDLWMGFADQWAVIFFIWGSFFWTSTVGQVIQLRASSNNRAQTVLELFLDAIQEYGVPVHIRGDRGGENVEVAIWIIRHRGPNRAAFMWGRYVFLKYIPFRG